MLFVFLVQNVPKTTHKIVQRTCIGIFYEVFLTDSRQYETTLLLKNIEISSAKLIVSICVLLTALCKSRAVSFYTATTAWARPLMTRSWAALLLETAIQSEHLHNIILISCSLTKRPISSSLMAKAKGGKTETYTAFVLRSLILMVSGSKTSCSNLSLFSNYK